MTRRYVFAACLALVGAAAAAPSVTATATTFALRLRWPDTPVTSRTRLEACRRDTPAAAPPPSAFTAACKRRSGSLAFPARGSCRRDDGQRSALRRGLREIGLADASNASGETP